MTEIRQNSPSSDLRIVPNLRSVNDQSVLGNMRNMNFNSDRLVPFLDEDSILVDDFPEYRADYSGDTNCTSHRQVGASLALNTYNSRSGVMFFSDDHKVCIDGNYCGIFKDEKCPEVLISSVKFGDSVVNFFSENLPQTSLAENCRVRVNINAFATKINLLSGSPADNTYGLQLLNDYDGAVVNRNEYKLRGKIVEVLEVPSYQNSYFAKYIIQVNNRGTMLSVPVFIHQNVRKNNPQLTIDSLVDLNVNLHGTYETPAAPTVKS